MGCIKGANPVGEQGIHNCMSPKYHVKFTSFNWSAKVSQAIFSKTPQNFLLITMVTPQGDLKLQRSELMK